MSKTSQKPLSDQQIRKAFEDMRVDLVKYALHLLAFQKVLVQQGLVTEAQITEAMTQAANEMKAANNAIRQSPSRKVQ